MLNKYKKIILLILMEREDRATKNRKEKGIRIIKRRKERPTNTGFELHII